MKYLKFYRYLLPYWKREVWILLLSSIGVVLGLINPYLTKLIIDKAYANKDLNLFIILVAVGGIIFILSGLVTGLNNYFNRYIKLRINFDLNRKVFKKLQLLPYGFSQDNSTGEHLYKISYDIEQSSQLIADLLPQAVVLIPRSLFILLIIFYMNWKMALLTLVLIPFLYISPYYFNRRLKKVFKVWIENLQGIFKRLQEVLSHIQLVKAFGKERHEIRAYIRDLAKNIKFSLKNTRLEATGLFVNSLTNRIISSCVLFYGGYQVIRGRMTLGSLSAIAIYLVQLSGMQSSFAQFFNQITLGVISYERLEKILDAKGEFREDENSKEIIFSKGSIEFKNVTFGYKNNEAVLNNLSFHIKGGSLIGLFGPSGCGKTTIINLLIRLFRPQCGNILIENCNLDIIKSKSLYQQIGVVLQEPYLWNDTIGNNIIYGKENADFKEVEEVAKIACIDGFINGLAQGYQTIIGENACKISEGQKQRIAIARALIKKPRILILDEALSCIDAETEILIINNIREFLRGSTIIIISHRLSPMKIIDALYFLASPGEVDIASHQELLQKNVKYRSYLAQNSKIEKAPPCF